MNIKYDKSQILVVFFLGITSFTTALSVVFIPLFNFEDSFISHVLVVVTFIILFLLWNKWFAKSNVDIVNLLLLVQFIFFGGNSLLKVLNLPSKDYFPDYQTTHNDYILTNSIIILGILFFLFGATISSLKERNKKLFGGKFQYSNYHFDLAANMVFIIGAISLFIDFDLNWFNFSYKGFGETTIYKLLWGICLPTSGFLYATSNKKKYKFLGFIILIVLSIIYILLGNRGYSISVFLTTLWLYDNEVKKITKFKLSSISVVIIFVIGIFYQMKEYTVQQKLNFIGNLKNINFDYIFLSLFEESSVTYRTLIYTFKSIPIDKGYEWGVSYFWALSTVVPNVFGTSVHPSILFHQNPSEWLSWTFSPIQASRGYGYGFSNIGEAYYNFGIFGVIIIMFLLGFLMTGLTKNINNFNIQNNRYIIIITSIFISNLFWSVRNPLSSVIRDVFYQYALILIIIIFINLISKKTYKN